MDCFERSCVNVSFEEYRENIGTIAASIHVTSFGRKPIIFHYYWNKKEIATDTAVSNRSFETNNAKFASDLEAVWEFMKLVRQTGEIHEGEHGYFGARR